MLKHGTWIKALKCDTNACVEAAAQVGPLPPAGHLEATRTDDGVILLRNSSQPEVEVPFTHEEWRIFLDGCAAGDFRLP
jgi:hypothetical protein